MLKKENRLKTVKLNNPRTFSTPQIVLKIEKNDQSLNRFAFIISKKIDKRAVVRNSLRRKITSSIEEIFDSIKVGFDFIVYPKSSLVNLEREEILKEVKNVFAKGNYLND